MKLINVKKDQVFLYKNTKYTIDQYGSYGGRKVPVLNTETGEKGRIPASTEVEVIEETKQEEPAVAELVEEEKTPAYPFQSYAFEELDTVEPIEIEEDESDNY